MPPLRCFRQEFNVGVQNCVGVTSVFAAEAKKDFPNLCTSGVILAMISSLTLSKMAWLGMEFTDLRYLQ
jgi:hypothetical protein